MNQVILNGVLGDHDVAHQLRVDRHFDFERVFDRANRTDGVDGGANPAEALRKGPSILGIAPLENDFDAAPHLRRGPGFGDVVAVHFDVDS